MDFNRLLGSLQNNNNYNNQFAQKLRNSSAVRDAAMKPAADGDEECCEKTKAANATGLENLLNQLSNTLKNVAQPEANPLANSPTLKSLMDHLPAGMMNKVDEFFAQMGPNATQNMNELMSRLAPGTLNKARNFLENLSPEGVKKGMELLNLMFQGGDRVFNQPENLDNFLNATNQAVISGADLDNFLKTAFHVYRSGNDMGAFIDASINVLKHADPGSGYDDFRRFLSVGEMAIRRGENMDDYYAFSDRAMAESPHDYEGNIFSAYTAMAHGAKLSDYVSIYDGLQLTGFEGRNNSVDLNRITIDFRNKRGYVPMLYQHMGNIAESGGDVRGWMDRYMAENGLRDTRPDFNLFDRIERIDGDPMTIKKGESAALFGQAISSRDGLLPESVLFWSSLEDGAISNGSSYLDLSKLDVGVHHIAVKIGNYGGGTDTAYKTVIVEPADKIKDDNGHGNDADGVDESNPGASQGVSKGGAATEEEEEGVNLVFPNKVTLPVDGKLKITVEKGSAGLDSDLYIRRNGEDQLVTEKAQTNTGFSLEQDYKKGEVLDFFIRTHGEKMGMGTYDHGTNTYPYEDGRFYVKADQLSDTSWRLSFEDLPGDRADWDYNDVVVRIDLMPAKVKDDNGHGNDADGVDESNPGASLGVSKGGNNKKPTAEEAAATTAQAIEAINNGATGEEVAEILNDRYFKALDETVLKNTQYVAYLEDFVKDQLAKGTDPRKIQDLINHMNEQLQAQHG